MSVTHTQTTSARKAHEWLVEDTDLFNNIIEHAGQHDAKLDSAANSSLAAHIINAITVGVNTFIYKTVGPDGNVESYEEEIRVLASALALHDTNKYVQEAYGYDAEGNTSDAFDHYFESDDFGIKDFLGEGYRDDLHYLVQNTEIREDSTETRGAQTEFRGLERYARIGDQVASVALREGIEGAYEKLCEKVNDSEIHLLQFTELEQPVLNDLLLGSVKEVIAGRVDGQSRGVIIGSSTDNVLYLGNEVERDVLFNQSQKRVTERIKTFEFSCKLTWNAFDYDILDELSLPLDLKKNIISEQTSELLLSDAGGTEPVEDIPDGFIEFLPVLIKAIYEDNRKNYPTEELNNLYQSVYESIEGGKSAKGQKIKLNFLQRLCVEYPSHAEDLKDLKKEVEPDLDSDLETETDAIGMIVQRFFQGQKIPVLASKEEMCFLCGAETDTKYQKGFSGVYRTQEFSRRVPPHAKYKSICEVCNLEYALFADICERSDVSTNNDVEVAYFYFDDFLGDIRVRTRRVGNIVQGDSDEFDDRELSRSLIGPQYYLQPIYVLDENHRMAVIRQAMETAQESGMKVVVGRPFARFESADTVFTDQEATRPQELLGLDEVKRFGPLPDFAEGETHSHLERALSLFKIMSMVGQEAGMNNPYIHLDRDTFHSIANFAVVNHDQATRLSELRSYFETYHNDALMEMKTVAERGVDLFGKQYDSKYKKTKIFREAIDAFLSGMNQQMDNEQLIPYVESQVYAAADREDYAGYVKPKEARAFVESIRTYLVENDLYDLKKLSDWEDALVNSYYYAYDQLLQE
jgi:CRISPR-associated protein Csc3